MPPPRTQPERNAARRCALLLAAAMAAGGLAWGQARPSFRLSYARAEGAEGCPDEAALRRAVAARLGYDPFTAEAGPGIAVELSAAPSLRARVRLLDAQGQARGDRQMTSTAAQCGALLDAVALAVSIAIDPLADPASSAGAPSASPSSTAPPASAAPSSPAAPAAPAASEAEPGAQRAPDDGQRPAAGWRPRLAAAVHGAAGAGPGLTLGATVQAGVRRGRGSLSLEARVDRATGRDAGNGGHIEGALWLGALVPCLHAGATQLCAVAAAGVMRGEGSGVQEPRSAATPYAALGPRAGVEVPLTGGVALWFAGDLLVPLTPTSLRLEGRPVWDTPAVAASLRVGAVAHFP